MAIDYNGQVKITVPNPLQSVRDEPTTIDVVIDCALDLSLVQYITEYINPSTAQKLEGYTQVYILGAPVPLVVVEDYAVFKALL
tara:strand:+ start:1254 stop:1505 length:252 start_codon:yes stop_codon:yes gene_type:complete